MTAKSKRLFLKIRAVLSLSFLLIYAVSSLRLTSLHQLFHAENLTELHTAAKESDLCHKSIYHQDENGCGHKSHISENSNCPVCDHSGTNKLFIENPEQLHIEFQVAQTEIALEHDYYIALTAHYFLRGPPSQRA